MKQKPSSFLSETDILAVAFPWNQHPNLFKAKIGVLDLIRCMKQKPCSYLSETDIRAVTHYPEINIQTFFKLKSEFLTLFVAWNKNLVRFARFIITKAFFCIRYYLKMKSNPAKKTPEQCFLGRTKPTCQNSATFEQFKKWPRNQGDVLARGPSIIPNPRKI